MMEPSRRTVLVVEDEPQMQVILCDNLEFEGFEVLVVSTGEEGLEAVTQQHPDVVLLDVMLPKMSGYELCRRIRASGSNVPIIMLTARNAEIDRITGLEFGADDYVGKPFSIRELLARVRAHMRRQESSRVSAPALSIGDVEVHLTLREVRRGGDLIDLSSREFDLLAYLIAHRGQLVTREQLLHEVWGYHSSPLTRTVDNFVAKLRRKIEQDAHEPRHILTVHGSGYRFML
jgi:DNA-binding response OmpR family regulator